MFRPRIKVRLSDEGRAKLVARLDMRGTVVCYRHPLVTVIEDGSGAREDYHEDFLETASERRKEPKR